MGPFSQWIMGRALCPPLKLSHPSPRNNWMTDLYRDNKTWEGLDKSLPHLQPRQRLVHFAMCHRFDNLAAQQFLEAWAFIES